MNNYLVIINPNSGNGKSEIIFRDYVSPKLKENKVNFNVHIDEVPIGIMDIIDISKIIIIGGDGTIVPIIDFLYKNNYDIPICHIPCGSGNGLCKSILYEMGKDYNLENAVDLINKDTYNKMNLFDVTLKEEQDLIPSFLSISWGIISDIDIETEWLRYFGSTRFTYGAIISLIKKRSYYGTLKYIEKINGRNVWKEVECNFLYFLASNLSHISHNTYSNPGALLDDEYIHITYIDDSISRYDLFWLLLGLDEGKHLEYLKYIKTKAFELIPEEGKLVIDGELKNLQEIHVKVSDSKISVVV